MIDDFLSVDGVLSTALGGYEDRPGQRDMARAVEGAFDEGHHLIVEAGTGTGKSLAYLLPALESQRKVVVSTKTKALQDQLLRKDLPVLQDALQRPFEAVALKGTGNYLCLRKYHAAKHLHRDGDERDRWLALELWVGETDVGDKSELTELPENDGLWSEVTTSPDSRLGPRCPYYEQCFVTRARRRAEEADLVVVNHHLFFADLALRKVSEGGRVLPDYEAVVFDEAHQLEDVMTEHFSVDVSNSRLEQLFRDWRNHIARYPEESQDLWLPKRSESLIAAASGLAQEFFADLRRVLTPIANRVEAERFPLPEELIDEGLRARWLDLDDAMAELQAHGQLGSDTQRDNEGGQRDQAAEEMRVLSARCQRFRDDLATLSDRDLDRREHVYWGQLRGLHVSMHASPITVDRILEDELLEGVDSAVFTSATLSARGSFEHFRRRLGLGPELADELCVPSPFDYQAQSMLYLARDIPDPREPLGHRQRFEQVRDLLLLSDGGALLLFTSYAAMKEAHRALRSLLDLPMWMQGQGPKSHLLEQFRASERGILLATASFWEGVDIPGHALRQVLIDKLPFEVPNDPLCAARMDELAREGLEPFEHYQLPRAAIAFRQGVGRLIRRKGDRGIVSVLDPRIVTRRYGRFFLDSLPDMPRTSSLERVRRWWQDAPALGAP